MTLTIVLKNFGSKLDFSKFIAHVTKQSSEMKAQTKSEKKTMAFGKLLILTAIIEAEVLISDSIAKEDLVIITNDITLQLVHLWTKHLGYREAILALYNKLFVQLLSTKSEKPKKNNKLASILLNIVHNIVSPLFQPIENLEKPKEIMNTRIINDASSLSLMLYTKTFLLDLETLASKDRSELLESDNIECINDWSIHENSQILFEKIIKLLASDIVTKQFPKPHSLVKNLANYIRRPENIKIIKSLWQVVFEEY